MNSYINITVAVAGAKAQAQIRALEAQVARLRGQMAAGTAAAGGFASSVGRMAAIGKWGNQLQWAGRQLMYNFTLPIVIAGAAATKFYMDNEKGMVSLVKVYGDLSMSQQVITNETNALRGAFRALSDEYGINQAEVIKVGAMWAQAGASGIALAKATDITLQTMILGELDAVKATESLIAIQAQYRFSTTELMFAIQQLNIIENQTGTSMAGLIEAMSRSAGVARTAGIDVAHLGAIIAALTPAAGSAAQAGNAIKTIISRLLAPTKDAVALLGAMGIQVNSMSWQSSNASDRLVTLATSFEKLSDSQKAVVSSTLASRFQINKFEVLMDSITTKGSYYWKALDATADRNKVLAQATRELNTVLNSSPKVFERAWVILQNAMAQIIVPLIPVILGVATAVADLATKFSQLSPETQKTVAFLLLFLAAIGPIARYIGSVAQLASILGRAFLEIGKFAAFAVRGVWLFFAGLGPVGWAVIAVIAIFMIFQDKIEQVVQNVIKYFQNLPPNIAQSFKPVIDFFNKAVQFIIQCFNALPQGVQNALIAVLNIVKTIVVQVYEWFSYLNPFAHHSPSLVENVTKGLAVVRAQFATLYSIGPILAKTYQDIKRFGQATAGFKFEFDTFKRLQDFKLVQKYLPGAAAAFRALAADVQALNKQLDAMQPALDAQKNVVEQWKDKLDAANAALDTEESKLRDLQKVADGYKAKMDAAQDALNNFAQAPIEGMRAMDDAIFQNTMDQKKLQLEMMKMEDVTGTLTDLQSKIQSINGEIETLQGTQKDLVNAGAGSDITAFYDEQIKALQQTKKTAEGNMGALNDMQSQLDALQRTATEMNLERDLAFDPLTRQIEQAANAMKELPFDEIMAGITASKAEVDKYAEAYANASAEVAKQQAVVDELTAERDKIQASYDAENKKLEQMQKQYDKVAEAIRAANQALDDIISSMNEANQAGAGSAGGALSNFNDAAGGNFPAVGGTTGGVGREFPNIKDQSALIDQFTKDTQEKIGKMFDGIDIFGPIREQWDKVVAWWNANIMPAWNEFANWFSEIWDKALVGLDIVWGYIQGGWNTLAGWLSSLWDLIGGDLTTLWNQLVKSFQDAWNKLAPKVKEIFDKLGPLFDALKPTLEMIFNTLKIVAAVLGGIFLAALKIVIAIIANVFGPIFDGIVGALGGFLDMLSSVISFITDVFTGQWSNAFADLGGIWDGFWDIIVNVFSTFGGTLLGIVEGIVGGIVGFFQWLWDILVGHSIIPDLVNAIVGWFAKLPGWVVDAIKTLGSKIGGVITAAWSWFTTKAGEGWNLAKAFFTSIPGKVADAIGAVATFLGGKGKDFLGGLLGGAIDKGKELWTWVSKIPGTILDKLGSMTKTLYYSGRNLIQGLLDGAGSLLRTMGSWFLDKIPSWIRTPFEKAMGISSPSKVFKGYGKNIIDGLNVGLDKGMGSVAKRVDTLASTLQGVSLSTIANAIPGAITLEAVVARADARVAAATTPTPTVYGGASTGSKTINFNGDLSFPNITNPSDAKTFLDNLEALAKG